METPHEALRRHVTGAIEAGKAEPIVEIPASAVVNKKTGETVKLPEHWTCARVQRVPLTHD